METGSSNAFTEYLVSNRFCIRKHIHSAQVKDDLAENSIEPLSSLLVAVRAPVIVSKLTAFYQLRPLVKQTWHRTRPTLNGLQSGMLAMVVRSRECLTIEPIFYRFITPTSSEQLMKKNSGLSQIVPISHGSIGHRHGQEAQLSEVPG